MTTKPRRGFMEPPRQRVPDANALELFARVVAAGSFAQAARELGQTRAAISRRVAALEEQIGAPLFTRSTRLLALSEAGRRLAQRARAVQEAAEAARRALRRGPAQGLTGTLRVTSVPILGQHVLAPLLARFAAQHPQLRLELRFTHRRMDLARDEVDVAFRITDQPPDDCVATPLLRYAARAYAAPGALPALAHPEALAQQACLLLGVAGEERSMRWLHDDGHATHVVLPAAMQSDELGTLLAVARAGHGVVLAPDFSVSEDLREGRLVDVLPGWRLHVPEGHTVQALTLPLHEAPESARALVAWVREALGATGASHFFVDAATAVPTVRSPRPVSAEDVKTLQDE